MLRGGMRGDDEQQPGNDEYPARKTEGTLSFTQSKLRRNKNSDDIKSRYVHSRDARSRLHGRSVANEEC
jgi:hypothetical protein